MSWLSSWLNKQFGVPEVHITTAEAVNVAITAGKVAIQDELSGKVGTQLINDILAAVETSAEAVLTAHIAAMPTPTPPVA